MDQGRVTPIIAATAPASPWWVPVATGMLAVMVTLVSLASLVTGYSRLLTKLNVLGTIVHEGGHAVVGIVTGGGVYRFEITSPDTGTTYGWYPSWFSSVATGVAGYAMPSLVGLGVAALLHRGHAAAVLTLTVVAMVLLLFVARDMITLGSLLAVGVLAFAALRWAPVWLQGGIAYAEAWLLLTSEIGGIAALLATRIRGHQAGTDDAKGLAQETHVPSLVWIVGWLAVIGWALWNAVPLLWP
jgi:hypothetical protein